MVARGVCDRVHLSAKYAVVAMKKWSKHDCGFYILSFLNVCVRIDRCGP